MLDLSVIILTLNEELDIARCIESVLPLTRNIFVVDSFSTDATVAVAESLGAKVCRRKWKNYSDQFQWALDNLPFASTWVMRLDGNEYLEQPLQGELATKLPSLPDDVNGVFLNMKVFFNGRWIRYGGFYPLILLRIWRVGHGRIERRWMDEHIVLNAGSKTITMQHNMVDDNRKGISFWVGKHNAYASREAVDILNKKYSFFQDDDAFAAFDGGQAKMKRLMKDGLYSFCPLGVRALLYFLYRYFFRFGFLDGKNGFVFNFMQGFWYRFLVDLKVNEIEKMSGGSVEKIKQILLEKHGIRLD